MKNSSFFFKMNVQQTGVLFCYDMGEPEASVFAFSTKARGHCVIAIPESLILCSFLGNQSIISYSFSQNLSQRYHFTAHSKENAVGGIF